MPAVHEWAITAAYGIFSMVSLVDSLALKRVRPNEGAEGPLPTLLIAGGNAEKWLKESLPLFKGEGFRIYYFDLESSDGSVEAARSQGVTVLTGKPPKDASPLDYAFHRLALTASEDSPDGWWAFMTALALPTQGLASSLRSWIAEEGRRFSHLAGRPSVRESSLKNLLVSVWYEWLPGAAHRANFYSSSPTPHFSASDPTIHLWRASKCMEEVIAQSKPPLYGGVVVPPKELRPRRGLISALHHTHLGWATQERMILLRLIVLAWGWILAGSLWPLALLFLFSSYIATAITSQSILKVLTILPLSVAAAPAVMLRIHFTLTSMRSKR